jgi:protein lifeguard
LELLVISNCLVFLIFVILIQFLNIFLKASLYDTRIVIQAFFLTAAIVICLTLYTLQSKRDFKPAGAILSSLLLLLLMGGIMQIIMQSPLVEVGLAVFGAFLFSAFIVYDTQMIMRTLNAEEYIIGVINLYLDIINLFLEILRLLNSSKE